jgi:hypothetical protein
VCIAGNTFTGDLALAAPTPGTEFPLGVRNGVIQGFTNNFCQGYSLPDAGDTSTPTVVVQTVQSSNGGATEAFVSSQGDAKLWKQTLSGSTWTGNGWASLPLGTQPRGLFLDGMGHVGGGGVAGNGAVFATDSAGTLGGMVAHWVSASNAGAPVVGRDFVLWANTTGGVTKVEYRPTSGAFGATQDVKTTLGNLQSVMPLLGEGNLVYLLTSTGKLSVRRVSDLTEVWGGNVVSAATAAAQLALDVYRGTGTRCGKPLGVLYVLTKQGATATLTAVLVDSRGLQADAPWPKYQRDNANTGNLSQPLAPWTCP